MGFKPQINPKAALNFTSANKDRRKQFHIEQKRVRDSLKRDERFRRKRSERDDPELRRQRLAKNKPHTIDSKRKWDEALGDDEDDDMLGKVVDLEQLSKRKRTVEPEDAPPPQIAANDEAEAEDVDSMLEDSDDADSMLDESDAEDAEKADDADDRSQPSEDLDAPPREFSRAASVSASTISTVLDIAPEALLGKFPTLFNPPPNPKVLVTTSLNSTLHNQALEISGLFPNSTYVRRTAHRFAHKYSVTEIAEFASNRDFTTLIIVNEDQKIPCGLDIVHLPAGPMFHFTMTNWIEGKKLVGHGRAHGHNPELILRGFRTPLGVLTGSVLRSMIPQAPELQGRQVVTFHNQRDFVFVRRHRYVFRDKRKTEKSALDDEGAPLKSVEDIKVGLQELGPRFTLKLRRVDKGIQRKSGQLWEWKGKTDRIRTKFQL
jgi:ribosome production factor 1